MPTNRPKRDFSPQTQKTLAIVNGVIFLPPYHATTTSESPWRL